MSQISAADNLIIEVESGRWRLIVNQDRNPRVMVEAVEGAPLRYSPDFGSTRRLPSSGSLPVADIQRVVLGWSAKDEAWHLGLVLETAQATARGSRWCEIARWPDIEGNLFQDMAAQAGKSLGSALSRPFNLVTRRVEPEAPPQPQKPLPGLPLTVGLWTLSWANGQRASLGDHSRSGPLEFVRTSGWRVSKVMRILWYTFWVAVYLVLSIATLTRTLALPNSGTLLPSPEFLPYMGLAAAVVLIGMILYMIYELVSQPDHIVVDPDTHTVRALLGTRERWRVTTDEAQSVYVTQVVDHKPDKRLIYHGELNLHLGGGKFYRLLEQGAAEEDKGARNTTSANGQEAVLPLAAGQETVLPLTPDRVDTDLQAAGLYIAGALGGLPCWYDVRAK